MASLLAGEASYNGASDGNFKASQEKIEEDGAHWYFSRKDIEENSPSRRDGIDLKKETYLRKSYCTLLQDLGMRLKVWKTKKPNLDCGIFLMNNMELFKGEAYATPNLGTAMVRRALRATYCARIIMSDVSEKKSEVRRMVVDFYNSMPGLINAKIEKKNAEAAGHKKKKKMKH